MFSIALHSYRVRVVITLAVLIGVFLVYYFIQTPEGVDNEAREYTMEEKMAILAQLSLNHATSSDTEKKAALKSLESSQEGDAESPTEEEKLRLLQSLNAN